MSAGGSRFTPEQIAQQAERVVARVPEPSLRWLLIAIGVGYVVLFLVLPLVTVFAEAFAKGVSAYLHALAQPDARSAILPDAADRGDRGAAQRELWPHRGVGDHQVRLPRQRAR